MKAGSTKRNELLRLPEAALYLRISESTLYKHVQARRVPFEKAGGILVFRKSALDEWLKRNAEARPAQPAA